MLSLSKHINSVAASPTMKIAQQAKELLAKGEDLIDLSVGEPDFPTPQNIKNAAIKALETQALLSWEMQLQVNLKTKIILNINRMK